jgi:hypothetical protein
MATATDTDIQEIKTAIVSLTTGLEANTKATAALTLEIRVGFANIDTKFAKLEGRIDNLETKLEGQINTAEAKLEGKIDQLDERTKLGFWGFIFRGTALAALAAPTAIFVKYLFPILPTELPKL